MAPIPQSVAAATRTLSPSLFKPLTIGDMELKNRIFMSPMTRGRSDNKTRLANVLMKEYYVQRADAGLLITEGTAMSAQGYGWNNVPGIYTPEMAESWKPITAAVHEAGGKIFCQLWHTGRAGHSSFNGGTKPVAPSAIAIPQQAHTPNGKEPYEVPRPLEAGEVPGIVADYVNAAELSLAAGFDGVEVHSANGYLLDSFLQSKTNTRTDEYGGSFANRYRLLGQVLTGILGVLPSKKVAVRLSPNTDYNDMGSPDYRESFEYYIKQLAGLDLAYLHAVTGTSFGWHDLGPPVTPEDVREWYPGTLVVNCGYSQEDGEQFVAAGVADGVAYGRPFINNPDLVARFANNWPIDTSYNFATFYSNGPEGYTDFPVYSNGGK